MFFIISEKGTVEGLLTTLMSFDKFSRGSLPGWRRFPSFSFVLFQLLLQRSFPFFMYKNCVVFINSLAHTCWVENIRTLFRLYVVFHFISLVSSLAHTCWVENIRTLFSLYVIFHFFIAFADFYMPSWKVYRQSCWL